MFSFCANYGNTVANTASLALFHWFWHSSKNNEDDNSVVSIIPSPYDYKFLGSIISFIKDKFGKNFVLPSHFLEERWYNDLKIDDFKNVQEGIQQKNPKIITYEMICVDILKLLSNSGQIKELSIKGEV